MIRGGGPALPDEDAGPTRAIAASVAKRRRDGRSLTEMTSVRRRVRTEKRALSRTCLATRESARPRACSAWRRRRAHVRRDLLRSTQPNRDRLSGAVCDVIRKIRPFELGLEQACCTGVRTAEPSLLERTREVGPDERSKIDCSRGKSNA